MYCNLVNNDTYCMPNNCYNNQYPMSNIRYDGDRFKVNANVTTTGALCFVGGCAVGAILTYYFLNKTKENK